MKKNMIIGMALLVAGSAFAQEFDDMYFRSKDREALEKANAQLYTSNYENFKKKNFEESTMMDEYNNPTDSYSARNINPEYVARSYSKVASEDEENYFVENYTGLKSGTNYSSGYYVNNLNNQMYSPFFSPGWYAPSYYNYWNNPYSYYGGRDPWLNPYWYGSNYGWSMSANYFWGNPFSMGWNYGLGYTWGNPYYGNSWGSSWYNPCPYPTRIVMVNGEASRPNYGKRPSSYSSQTVNNVSSHYYKRSNSTAVNTNDTRGRLSKSSDEYYVRPSRRIYSESNTSSYSGMNNSSSYRFNNTNSGSSRLNNSNSSFGSFSTPSRSSMGSMSSPSRSSGSSSSGSSSSGSSSSGSRRGNN